MPSIKRIDLSLDFKSLEVEAFAIGDKNDCAVKAVAIVCDVPYKLVHERLTALGRKKGRGTKRTTTESLVKSLGFEIRKWTFKERLDMVKSYPSPHCRVLHNITIHHPRRFPAAWANVHPNLLLFSRGHVSALKNGQLIDWAVNKAKRVYEVWEIREIRKV